MTYYLFSIRTFQIKKIVKLLICSQILIFRLSEFLLIIDYPEYCYRFFMFIQMCCAIWPVMLQLYLWTNIWLLGWSIHWDVKRFVYLFIIQYIIQYIVRSLISIMHSIYDLYAIHIICLERISMYYHREYFATYYVA